MRERFNESNGVWDPASGVPQESFGKKISNWRGDGERERGKDKSAWARRGSGAKKIEPAPEIPPPAKKAKQAMDLSLLVNDLEVLKRGDRAMRFSKAPAAAKRKVQATTTRRELLDVEAATADAIVGTCMDLEKRYLRLTSAPKLDKVRPEPVLKQTLAMLKAKWALPSPPLYIYMCEQLKSVRQVRTVFSGRGNSRFF